MMRSVTACFSLLVFLSLSLISCGDPEFAGTDKVFTNAVVWDGVSDRFAENRAILVDDDGAIISVTDMRNPDIPQDVETIDLESRFVVPGLINAHGHVGMADGLETGPDIYTEENVLDQLQLYARYGVTTVVSLGDEPPQAFTVRHDRNPAEKGIARLFLSGPVLNPDSPETAAEDVERLMEQRPDWTKIRVDDGLGTREKMPPEVYQAVIEASHEHGVPLAAHIVYLKDAVGVMHAGADLIGHSVRDEPVSDELIELMLERDICITPTLTREISVFIYAERPDFFDDPFFLEYADSDVLEELQAPEVQERFTGDAADFYREALPLAKENMMALHNAGIRVALGTDSGPPARFQGYFEHMEMEMMQDAGMTPFEVLTSATRYAAECMGIEDKAGTLQAGKQADFLVLPENPFDDIRALRTMTDIFVGGNPVE